MIHNVQELAVNAGAHWYFQRVLAQLRVTASPEEFPAVASSYRAEIVRMQDEVLAYLTRHATTPTPAELWK